MVRRPFEGVRPLGPLLGRGRDVSQGEVEEQDTQEQVVESTNDVHFNSLSELPDSPMLKEYVRRQANYLDEDIEVIINSKPVKQYMKRLGVWEQAIQEQ